jgi:NADH-quinone oxidoreductase subunit A
MFADYAPIFLMLVLALGLALTLLKAAEFLGPRRPRRVKASAYESGMDPVGTARERYSVKFYLVAMIFIVFDVEVVFMYPWAVSFNDFLEAGLGLGAFLSMLVFVGILVIGLIYDIKKGGLEWD